MICVRVGRRTWRADRTSKSTTSAVDSRFTSCAFSRFSWPSILDLRSERLTSKSHTMNVTQRVSSLEMRFCHHTFREMRTNRVAVTRQSSFTTSGDAVPVVTTAYLQFLAHAGNVRT